MYGAVMEKERKNVTSAVRSTGRPYGRENRTGIPTQLKERMEQSTGLSFDDVRVHYNSALPARLDALAYTQRNQVEIGPGQERHLPHELGHVVQQKLGAVRANATHSSGVALNTDPALEHQADELGAGKKLAIVQRMRNNNIIQRCGDKEASPGGEKKEDQGQEHGSAGTDVAVGEGGGPTDPNALKDNGDGTWTSKMGLIYGQGSRHGNRVAHVKQHTYPDPSKDVHTVFNVDESNVIALVDEAWAKKGKGNQQGHNVCYDIDMERIIGTNSETFIRIITRGFTNYIITAFPRKEVK